MKRKAFFFDRDGIVNRRILGGYVTKPEEFEFLPDFIPLFQLVQAHGYFTAVITNQQGIGKGLMTEEDLSEVHKYMQINLLKLTDKSFDAVYYCGDLHQAMSYRRKPNPGMIFEAIAEHSLDPGTSFMLGDSISDVQAGKSAGCTTILVGEFTRSEVPEADHIVATLAECIKFLETYLQ